MNMMLFLSGIRVTAGQHKPQVIKISKFLAKYCNKPAKNYDFVNRQHNVTGLGL